MYTKKDNIQRSVAQILDSVKKQGDAALVRWTKVLDKVRLKPQELEVRQSEIQSAVKALPSDTKQALEQAYRNILFFHKQELKRQSRSWSISQKGIRLGQQIVPVERVGVYVPGGRFSYPSTVLMSCVPAKAAGVKEIVVATPPRGITPEVLYAAQLAGAARIFRLGGPAAIAALAFGTRTVPQVDLIVGPGNAFVTEAKRQVFGQVGIDMLAGPSEIVILADDSADPAFVASDLEAQAEHDPAARAVLISTSRTLARLVQESLAVSLRRQISVEVIKNLEAAKIRVNQIAPEHLELQVRHSKDLSSWPWKAGAIFYGPYSPVALGDYWAGPSHVLPTGRSARWSSGISVATFWKRSSVIDYKAQALKQSAPWIGRLAKSEGLVLHAKSVLQRVQKSGVRSQRRVKQNA